MDKTQWIAIGSGFAAGAVFKALELLSSASAHDVLKQPREWVATAIFGVLAGGASFVLARWTPTGGAK